MAEKTDVAPPQDAFLNVPPQEPRTFNRNFLKLVACELKFPTVMELEFGAIKRFQHALRKTLPIYDSPQTVKVPLGDTGKKVEQSVTHRFTSKRREIVFTFTPDSLTLQTEKYRSFEEFTDLLQRIVAEALPIIDTDFYTRVGLRYINAIPFERRDLGSIEGWVNPLLVSTLTSGIYGNLSQYAQFVLGTIPEGNYAFRHGISTEGDRAGHDYMLDFDFFTENLDVDETFNRLKVFRNRSFGLFMWALGEKAKAHLAPGAAKNA